MPVSDFMIDLLYLTVKSSARAIDWGAFRTLHHSWLWFTPL